jgi:hypothetical protein
MSIPRLSSDSQDLGSGGDTLLPTPGEASNSATVIQADGVQAIEIPDGSVLSHGDFSQSGQDLVLTGPSGADVIVQNYFAQDNPPDLVASGGAQALSPQLVDSFLSSQAPGQYAQAGSAVGAQSIGQVGDVMGQAFAVRADGTRVPLEKGDPVFQGDIVETGGNESAVRMVFLDKTEFALGADAKLALDELVFNPATQSGSAQFSILKGVFVFSSGEIAKTDNTDMTVATPVGTIGIRGTEVAGRIDEGGGQFTVIDGAIEVITQAGSVTLDSQGETTRVSGIDAPPSAPFVLTPAEYGDAYGDVAGIASHLFQGGKPGQTGPDGTPGSPDQGETQSGQAGGSDSNAESGSGETASASNIPAEPAQQGESPAGVLASGGPASLEASLTDAPLAASIPTETSTSGLGTAPPVEEVVLAPGLDPADSLTFGGTGPNEPDGGTTPAPFDLGLPTDPSPTLTETTTADGGPPVPAGGGIVPVSYQGADDVIGSSGEETPTGPNDNDGGPANGGGSGGSVGVGGGPIGIPSSGGVSTDPIADNPYVPDPYGASGPDLGALIEELANETDDPDGSGFDLVATDDDDDPAPAPAPVVTETPTPPAAPAVHDIVLTVSNATASGQFQDLTDNFVLSNQGPGSFELIPGSDMDIAGLPGSVQVSLTRDTSGDVDIDLLSSWNSLKNLRAESDTAADLTVDNFVHTDIHFGGGGDSHITIIDAKRGFITTGDGNDTIEIDALSNVDSWSKLFDIETGAGNDTVVFDGAPNGLSELDYDGGAGIDTLQITGPDSSFDFSSGQMSVTNVERIDISGAADVTLTIPDDLIPAANTGINALTGTARTLVVDGDSRDTLNLTGDDWSQVDTAQIDGQGYAVYEHDSGMRVAADSDLTVV